MLRHEACYLALIVNGITPRKLVGVGRPAHPFERLVTACL